MKPEADGRIECQICERCHDGLTVRRGENSNGGARRWQSVDFNVAFENVRGLAVKSSSMGGRVDDLVIRDPLRFNSLNF